MTGLSWPDWTDDELLRELRGALQEAPVDEACVHAAEAAFAWRTVDADLEILSLETSLAPPAAAVRAGGQGARSFTFHAERLDVEIELDNDGIVGQLTPPGPAQISLVTTDGSLAIAEADEVGCFTLPAPPRGPWRLDCRRGPDHFLTEWTSA